jgi:ABC-2 type transport system ATP-binding protein
VSEIESKQVLAVKVQELAKHYGQFLAVDHISFGVRKGEFFGFLGPNGAGKTTTVRILTGVIKADGGSASILGYPVGSLKAKQVTGVVPDMANPYIELSAWDNLMLMAELYGVPASMARERSAVLLQDLGLLPRKDSLVKTYSKGMKQRLILCMALVSNPEVLFLDEPTSGLDVQSSHLIQDLLRRLNKAGNTIFLTTHNMDEANELCDRVAIINKGKIVAMDAPEKLRLATSSMHSVEVSFADTVNPEDLARLPGVNTINKMGDKYRLYTAAPGDLVVSLVNYSCSVGLKIVSLNILAPSLEDAFVALTGKVAKDG